MNIPLNNPYEQPDQHSFNLRVTPDSPRQDDMPATITLSNQQGMPLPWHLPQGSLEQLLQDHDPHHLDGHGTQELLTTVHPETGEEDDLLLHLSFRADPTGPSTNQNGIRSYRGTLSARTAGDPESPPLTRIWTVIDLDTGVPPVYCSVHTSPDLKFRETDERGARIAQRYGLAPVRERTSPQLELALAELAWDRQNGVYDTEHQAGLLNRLMNSRNAARWALEDRANGHVPEPGPQPQRTASR